jgi:hypothetical protein
MALGNSIDMDFTDNHLFYHYEERQLHPSVAVANQVSGAGAGNAVTITVGSSDYYESGAKSPVRLYEVVELASSGVQGQITAINTSTPNAHTATITPLSTTQNFVSAGSSNVLAGDLILFRGAVNIGEGSDKLNGLAPIWDKITNTVTEVRDDFTITDIADMEKQEIVTDPTTGQQYYYPAALSRLNQRYLNNVWFKVMEGTGVTSAITNSQGGSTNGTIGVIPRVQANGSTIQYTAGAPQIADIQALSRALNFFGAPGEYHMLMDVYGKQALDNLLFTTYKNTYHAATYESVGGSKEAGAAYGFDTYRLDNCTLHLMRNDMFNTEKIYKRVPTLGTDFYRHFSILIPQRVNQSKNGEEFPSFQLVWQKHRGSSERIATWETGGLAPMNKTTVANKTYSMLGYVGVRTFAPNQYAIFAGI